MPRTATLCATLAPVATLAAVLAAPATAHAQVAPESSAFEPVVYTTEPRLPMPRGANGPRYLGGPIPAGSHLAWQHPTNVLFAAGLSLLAGYAAAVAVWNLSVSGTCSADRDALCSNSAWLAVPVLGPWVALASSTSGELNVALIADGVVQAAGIAFGLIGVLTGYPVLVTNGDPTAARTRSHARRWGIAPSAGPAGAGLSFGATF